MVEVFLVRSIFFCWIQFNCFCHGAFRLWVYLIVYRVQKTKGPGDSSRDLLIPYVGGHDSPLKRSLNHPKKVTSRIARDMFVC